MSSSLIKFASRKEDGHGRGQLFWGRVGIDGLPFRGSSNPLFTDEEFEDRLVRIGDPQNGTFRTWIESENKELLSVYDEIVNGWSQLMYIRRWRDRKTGRIVVYLEWTRFQYEDGGPAPAPKGLPELSHGSTSSKSLVG